jgi:hypothetical protein
VTVGVTFLGGVVVIGIATALLHAIVSPPPDHVGNPAYGGSGHGAGSFDGGSGGGGGGGDGGDGGCG